MSKVGDISYRERDLMRGLFIIKDVIVLIYRSDILSSYMLHETKFCTSCTTFDRMVIGPLSLSGPMGIFELSFSWT